MNSIVLIAPYKFNGVWVFDDAAVGLIREPFVGNANVVIDMLVRDIPGAAEGFVLMFSSAFFPGYTLHARRVRGDEMGTFYQIESGMEFWLCPALFKYIFPAPDDIYARAQER